MNRDDVNTCLSVGVRGLTIVGGLILALCIAILLWA